MTKRSADSRVDEGICAQHLQVGVHAKRNNLCIERSRLVDVLCNALTCKIQVDSFEPVAQTL